MIWAAVPFPPQDDTHSEPADQAESGAVLGARSLSGVVARRLSGFMESFEEVTHETDGAATGGAEDAIRGGLRRLAGEATDAGGGGAAAGGVCERTFRRYVDRDEEEGFDGLVDKRLGQVSARRAPVDEVVRTEALYRERYEGWNVKHFYSFYRRVHGGGRAATPG